MKYFCERLHVDLIRLLEICNQLPRHVRLADFLDVAKTKLFWDESWEVRVYGQINVLDA